MKSIHYTQGVLPKDIVEVSYQNALCGCICILKRAAALLTSCPWLPSNHVNTLTVPRPPSNPTRLTHWQKYSIDWFVRRRSSVPPWVQSLSGRVLDWLDWTALTRMRDDWWGEVGYDGIECNPINRLGWDRMEWNGWVEGWDEMGKDGMKIGLD